jgi:endonuclease/exonuclease/phosphatase (EEP) superfamily protein YafD
MMHRFRHFPVRAGLILIAALLGISCSAQQGQVRPDARTGSASLVPETRQSDACRASLAEARPGAGAELDASNIRLVNWNIRKNSHSRWKQDYASVSNDRDLILIQEASLRADAVADMATESYWSFAPGFRNQAQVTGVLTLSSIKPLTQCSFVTMEPLLRTPKATSITQYGLTASDLTLIVVNVHAVNFSLGLNAFRRQFEDIAGVLENHHGPIILSGDFNTWRARRMGIVESLAERFALLPLGFEEDHRVRVLGKVLDHIFVRGLSAVVSETSAVTSSDHNPMTVTLTM